MKEELKNIDKIKNLNKYYSNLLIKQYQGNTRAKKTIEGLVNINSNIIFNFVGEWNNAFDLEKAEGKQLDIIGDIIGLTRKQLLKGLHVSDETYRYFIKFRIIRNISSTGINKMENNIFNAFNGNVIIINNYDMSIDYVINNKVSEETIEIIKNNKNLLPHPTGVGIKIIFKITTEKVFGYANDNGIIPVIIAGYSGNSMDELQEATYISDDNIM